MQRLVFNIVQSAPGFLLAIVFHEYAHGYVARMYGDDTAEKSGRLTLNPLSHIDPIGTILFPALGVAFGGVAFGWAKPVPINTRNFKNIKSGVFWVSFAGPLANLFLGAMSAFLYVLSRKHFPEFSIKTSIEQMLYYSVLINFVLMGFNLIPILPLDGGNMLRTFLKGNVLQKYEEIARFTPFIFIGAMFLSFNGGPNIFGYVLMPFMMLAEVIMTIFNVIL